MKVLRYAASFEVEFHAVGISIALFHQVKNCSLHLLYLFLVAALFHSSGYAVTLIITHPQNEHDLGSLAGPATLQLLRDPYYNKKIVLCDGGSPYTFRSQDAEFEPYFSKGGELGEVPLEFDETEFHLAGGLFHACFTLTVHDLILRSGGNVKLYFKMDAIYDLDETLSSTERNLGTEALKFGIRTFISNLYPQACEHFLGLKLDLGDKFTLRTHLHGKLIHTHVGGPAFIDLYFE